MIPPTFLLESKRFKSFNLRIDRDGLTTVSRGR